MQHCEQQHRAASSGGSLNSSGPSYLGVGGGISGYSPIIFFAEPSFIPLPLNAGDLAARVVPRVIGEGSAGSKQGKQAELLDALGGEVLATMGFGVEERTAPTTPTQAVTKPMIQKASGRGSVPEVEAERYGNFLHL